MEARKAGRPRAAIVVTLVGAVGLLGLVTRNAAPRETAESSSTTLPMSLYCERTIKPGLMEKYKEDWTAFSTHVYENSGPEVQAMWSAVSKDKPNSVIQYFHFKTVNGFFAQVNDIPELSTNLWSNFGGTPETDECEVWGGWIPPLRAATRSNPLVAYNMEPTLSGYMKTSAEGLEGPPVMFISKRKVVKGKMSEYGKAFQAVADWWFPNAPGLLAGVNFVSVDDPDAVWDLRIMANKKEGFFGHVAPAVFPYIMAWRPFWDTSVEFTHAVAISEEGGEPYIAANPANAVYTWYKWSDMIGGAHIDFNKNYRR